MQVPRRVSASVRWGAPPRGAVPGTAPHDPGTSLGEAGRIIRRRPPIVIICVAILTPFHGVPQHIEKAPPVRSLLAHRMDLFPGVHVEPCVLVQIGLVVPKWISR